MVQIQWLQAFLLVIGVIVTSVVVVATYRRALHEQQDANNETWQSAVGALKAHNEALAERLQDVEAHRSAQAQLLTELQQERNGWIKRNQRLYEYCETLRARLLSLGVKTEPMNGGD